MVPLSKYVTLVGFSSINPMFFLVFLDDFSSAGQNFQRLASLRLGHLTGQCFI
jgi:hypothetical protein